jgi:hypothetical protein
MGQGRMVAPGTEVHQEINQVNRQQAIDSLLHKIVQGGQELTTAQHIEAIAALYDRAHSDGFAAGMVAGANHTANAMSMIHDALMPGTLEPRRGA